MDRFLEDGKPMRDAFNEYMKKLHLDDKLIAIELNENWEKYAGTLVARHTTDLSYRNGKLILRIDSAPLKQEIGYNKAALIAKIHKGFGRIVIKELEVR